MHNGFYIDRDHLARSLLDDGEITSADECSFEFMEVDNLYGGYSPYDFLHGYCDIFAIYLSETYGYKIHSIWDGQDDRLIHAFCTNSANNYIDVRGRTNDFSELIAEFDLVPDDIGYPEDYRYYILDDVSPSYEEGYLKDIAREIDKAYRYFV